MNRKQAKTLKDLAKITGFTESTISRVLNGLGTKYRISDNTQTIIKKIAKETNFSFNENARGLRLRKTHTIGLIVPDISNSFFAKMASLIEQEARAHDYVIFLCDTDNTTALEQKMVSLLQKRKVDGFIISPVGMEHQHLERLYSNTPLVLVDRFFEQTEIPYVTSNDYEGSINALNYMIKLGHKNVTCIQGLESTSLNTNRVRAFKDVLEANAIVFEDHMLIGNAFSEQNGYASAKQLLSRDPKDRPTALFSLSNTITLGVLKAFAEENIMIPDDISILSFDEENYSGLLRTPMTTISQPKESIGKLAFEMLLEQIDAKDEKIVQKSISLPTKLLIRNSVKSITT